jgi:hypothetical protein
MLIFQPFFELHQLVDIDVLPVTKLLVGLLQQTDLFLPHSFDLMIGLIFIIRNLSLMLEWLNGIVDVRLAVDDWVSLDFL